MSQHTSRGGVSHVHATEGQIATIGSIPMRPMPISINITKDVEAHGDSRSDHNGMEYSDAMYDRKTKVPDSDEEIATVH